MPTAAGGMGPLGRRLANFLGVDTVDIRCVRGQQRVGGAARKRPREAGFTDTNQPFEKDISS